MRPIDADALLEKIKDWIEYCSGHTDIVHGLMRDVYESVVDDIKDAPTIDAAPVRRGEWEICLGGVLYCTACGKSADDFIGGLEGANYIEEPNFCPHCGADMRSVSE